jgi:hypothetical protein
MRMQSKGACCQEWTPYFILKLENLCLYVVQNFSGVTDMGGGYGAWKESGLPLQTQQSQQARQAWKCLGENIDTESVNDVI